MLYANESCDEHAFFLSAMIEMTRHATQVFFFGNDVISLQLRPLDFRVFIHVYSLRPQTYFRSYI